MMIECGFTHAHKCKYEFAPDDCRECFLWFEVTGGRINPQTGKKYFKYEVKKLYEDFRKGIKNDQSCL
jgi:hypothetical protein